MNEQLHSWTFNFREVAATWQIFFQRLLQFIRECRSKISIKIGSSTFAKIIAKKNCVGVFVWLARRTSTWHRYRYRYRYRYRRVESSSVHRDRSGDISRIGDDRSPSQSARQWNVQRSSGSECDGSAATSTGWSDHQPRGQRSLSVSEIEIGHRPGVGVTWAVRRGRMSNVVLNLVDLINGTGNREERLCDERSTSTPPPRQLFPRIYDERKHRVGWSSLSLILRSGGCCECCISRVFQRLAPCSLVLVAINSNQQVCVALSPSERFHSCSFIRRPSAVTKLRLYVLVPNLWVI